MTRFFTWLGVILIAVGLVGCYVNRSYMYDLNFTTYSDKYTIDEPFTDIQIQETNSDVKIIIEPSKSNKPYIKTNLTGDDITCNGYVEDNKLIVKITNSGEKILKILPKRSEVRIGISSNDYKNVKLQFDDSKITIKNSHFNNVTLEKLGTRSDMQESVSFVNSSVNNLNVINGFRKLYFENCNVTKIKGYANYIYIKTKNLKVGSVDFKTGSLSAFNLNDGKISDLKLKEGNVVANVNNSEVSKSEVEINRLFMNSKTSTFDNTNITTTHIISNLDKTTLDNSYIKANSGVFRNVKGSGSYKLDFNDVIARLNSPEMTNDLTINNTYGTTSLKGHFDKTVIKPNVYKVLGTNPNEKEDGALYKVTLTGEQGKVKFKKDKPITSFIEEKFGNEQTVTN